MTEFENEYVKKDDVMTYLNCFNWNMPRRQLIQRFRRMPSVTMPEQKKKYVALVNIRDSQVLSPEKDIPDPDTDENAYLETAQDDNNWKDIDVPGFIGVYEWNDSTESLRTFVAKQHKLHPETVEIREI